MIKYSSIFGISIQVLFIQLYRFEYQGILLVSLFQALPNNKASVCELEFGVMEMKQTQKVFVRPSPHCYNYMEWSCPKLALGRNQMAGSLHDLR